MDGSQFSKRRLVIDRWRLAVDEMQLTPVSDWVDGDWVVPCCGFRFLQGQTKTSLAHIQHTFELYFVLPIATPTYPPPLRKHGRGPKSQVKTAVQRPPRA